MLEVMKKRGIVRSLMKGKTMKKTRLLIVAGLLGFCLVGCDLNKIDFTNFRLLISSRYVKAYPRLNVVQVVRDAQCIPGTPNCE